MTLKRLQALAIKYEEPHLFILDQQKLPQQEEWIECHSIDDMCRMILSLKVRGAPLIGIAALLALAQYVNHGASLDEMKKAAKKLQETRPTAVNLVNYINYLLQQIQNDPQDYRQIVSNIAQHIFMEDVDLCEKMAMNGVNVLTENETVLTYCNTGGLATAGIGTALGVIKTGFRNGKIQHVYACETRPLLQGGRLTAWELENAQIPYTLICDNMAAFLMQQKKISSIFVGADRIATNGDFANKIGTYSLAVLANYHQIPFYVVAPYTTIDRSCQSGAKIVIEQREPYEVRGAIGSFGRVIWAPEHAPTYNPAFDITPANLVSAFILDKGIFKANEISSVR
ncbi:MAG: methylthioribose-1-phosphate isomerase [Coxiella sp. DG_40]|nr:MAG: methylthioribose-1-phosphate isomerase [Coxiella sp. DG_40]